MSPPQRRGRSGSQQAPSAATAAGGRSAPRRSGARRPGAGDRSEDRSSAQRRYDGPELPEDITGDELGPAVRRQLASLPERLGTRVARHLAAAGRLLDDDPETAYWHVQAARARASRLAVVREACGEAAYASGRFAEALAELRAARRMNGSPDYLPMMADCERAVGRPDRALALSRDDGVGRLDDAGRIEMTIVAAGARRDRQEIEAAVALLEAAPLHSASRAPWVARLRYAYADTLLEAGRTAEALEWFHRTVAVDSAAATDAVDRVAGLGGADEPARRTD